MLDYLAGTKGVAEDLCVPVWIPDLWVYSLESWIHGSGLHTGDAGITGDAEDLCIPSVESGSVGPQPWILDPQIRAPHVGCSISLRPLKRGGVKAQPAAVAHST